MLKDNVEMGLTFDDVLLKPAKSDILPQRQTSQLRLHRKVVLG
jgi:IMP dehydrogenase/GMP reductase